ncbi:MAG: chorismate-binding protein [Tenacibaculum sp.]|nr:chorismate-binding protein [Tenacibaculum sp.]
MDILEKIKIALKNNLPFVAYKYPDKTFISAFFQKNDELFVTENYLESGFVFAPFDDEKPAILIPDNSSEFIQQDINFNADFCSKNPYPLNDDSEEFHKSIVDKAIKAINNGDFEKVVLSRKEIVKINDFNVLEIFKKLLVTYDKSMVYLWFHPKVGLWLGATPETLFNICGNNIETMSLAGTKEFKGDVNVNWDFKEIEEQNIVTKSIIANLKLICKEVTSSNLETVKAGNLLHLKTKISGVLKDDFCDLKEVIHKIHPTPAVCGFPKIKAKKFIIDNENYNRKFYTGFLGELNLKLKTDTLYSNLFVNLRCMEIEDNNIIIYVGGGITKESNVCKEWEETVAKSKVIKNIL